MSDTSIDIINGLLGMLGGVIITLMIIDEFKVKKYPVEMVVTSANKSRVFTDVGLPIINKGFNVGDTLVIKKK